MSVQDSNKTIAENIRKYRELKGLSQGDLATTLRVDRSYISTLESGTRNPSIRTLDKVAGALGTSLAALVENPRFGRVGASDVISYVPGLIEMTRKDWSGKEWYHQRFDGSPYLMHMIAEAEVFTRRDDKYGLFFDRHFCFYDDGKADWYIDVTEIDRISSRMMELSRKEKGFHKRLIGEYRPLEKAFYDACEQIGKTMLHALSNRDLISLHDEYVRVILERNSSSSIIDGFALGTDRMLEERIRRTYESCPDVSDTLGFSETFSILTTPEHSSFIREAELGLFRLIVALRKRGDDGRKLIRNYRDRYFWIRNNYIDSNDLSIAYFEEEIARIESSGLDIEAEIARIENLPAENRRKKSELLGKLGLDDETRTLLSITEDFTAWQDDRKKATMYTCHHCTVILEEIARRIGLSADLLKYMSPREVSRIFLDTPTIDVLEKRRTQSVAYWDEDGHEILSGDMAALLHEELLGHKDMEDMKDFRGLTASLGSAQGSVKIVRSVKEIGHVKRGDVLVAVMTRPDYVPAMRIAAAIVTDEGGITSHAAIVARELKIPCVIGTKIATRMLHDGDLVQVNANHGVVRILERAPIGKSE